LREGFEWECACAIENSGQHLFSLQSEGGRSWRHIENPMLFIVGAIIVSIAVVIIPKMRVPGGANAAHLGWISEEWLAEHRASFSL